jgi:ATP-dependent Clp protease, protease subunit
VARNNLRSELDEIYSYGCNLEARKLYIMGGIDEDSVYKAVVGLDLLQQKSADRPVTIYLNTPGGDVYTGMSIYDAIRRFPAPVVIIGSGEVMSMGSFILQAGDERLLDENATVLLHHGSNTFDGNAIDYERWSEYGKQMRRRLVKILADRSGRTTTYWNNALKNDLLLSAEEAVSLGLADQVIKV